MNNNLIAVLKFKYPDKQWTVRGNALVEWNEPTPQPTQQELDAADVELTAAKQAKETQRQNVFNAINQRLGITVNSLEDLKRKRAAIYDAIDAKEDQVVSGNGTVDQKLNTLKQIWSARNKIESLLS